ncbi:PspC domain-containing protein [Sphingomonas sp. ASV193]|uniref:PspC domain-containing protein n=1 Tax=Sphingomonas sp. ASV193 TaxID=3144405 RepID=UPI0032E8C90B
MSRYSLDRRDKKLAGVASTLGDMFAIDPTFVRIGFVAVALMVSFKLALVAYLAAGLYLHFARRDALKRGIDRTRDRFADFGRPRRTSIREMRDSFDANDWRMMAIDHHLATQNDELAREIEKLREKQA